MLSPETMELERVSGVNAENPMHGHQIKSASSIRFVVDLCWSMLTCWQVACEDRTCTISRHFHGFHPHKRQKFLYPLKLTSLGHCGAWGPTVQPRGFVHQQVHEFRLALLSHQIHTGALPEHCWHPNWHPSIHRIDQYSHRCIWEVMIQCVETCLSFFTLAHGCPRRVPSADVKDMDELQNRMFQ